MLPRSSKTLLGAFPVGFKWTPTKCRSSYSTRSSIGFATRLPTFEGDRDEILRSIGGGTGSRAKVALERYYDLRKRAVEGGGQRGIERHVKKNKKVLIRDRIKALLDSDSEFLEIGDLAGFEMPYGDVPTAGAVIGIGKIQGVFCMIAGNDATVKAGSYYPITVTKSYRAREIAEILRVPSVHIPDSAGAFLPLQSEIFADKKHGGRGFYDQAVMSSKGIHQVALVCGSCTAGGAYHPTMCDEAIVVDRISKIFLAGPPLVKAATGEVVSDEDLGGAWLHSSISGCTDYFARDENEAFTMCRDIIYSLNMKTCGVLGTHFEEPTPTLPWTEIAESKEEFTKQDLYIILSGILDGSKFHEFKTYYGVTAITGTGCIEGRRIGIVSSVGDAGSQEALKICHFVSLCNMRNLPILFLHNFSVNENNIDDGDTKNDVDYSLLKCRGAAASAIATSNVPKIALTLSGLSQNGLLTMCGPGFQPNFHFTWPQAMFSDLEMTKSSENASFDAFYAAARMITDAIIPPSETRKKISFVLQIAEQQALNLLPQVDTGVLRM